MDTMITIKEGEEFEITFKELNKVLYTGIAESDTQASEIMVSLLMQLSLSDHRPITLTIKKL